MDRRTFLGALGLFVAPLAAEAQQAQKIPKVGLLSPGTPTAFRLNFEAFRQGLRELGHVEGKTWVLELRYADGRSERLPELARELVGLKPDVIVTASDPAIAAVKRETRTIPIVMAFSGDPVGTGFVTSLAHPGGTVTGLSAASPELSGKRLELLKQLVPRLSRVAFLWNPDVRSSVLDYKEMEASASSLHLELQSVEVSIGADVDRAFSTVMAQHAQALIVSPANPVVLSNRTEIAGLALKNRLPPGMFPTKEYVDQGGLVSYGPSVPFMWRRAATYTDKILRAPNPPTSPSSSPRSSSWSST